MTMKQKKLGIGWLGKTILGLFVFFSLFLSIVYALWLPIGIIWLFGITFWYIVIYKGDREENAKAEIAYKSKIKRIKRSIKRIEEIKDWKKSKLLRDQYDTLTDILEELEDRGPSTDDIESERAFTSVDKVDELLEALDKQRQQDAGFKLNTKYKDDEEDDEDE